MYKYIWQIIILPGLVTIAWFYGHLILEEPGPTSTNPEIPQTRLQSVSLLLNNNGTPEEYGYMTLPLKVFNEEKLLPWQKLRLKKWDHFDVITDRFIVSVSIADVFYIGEARLDYYDFATKAHKSFKKTFLFNQIPPLSHASYRFTGESDADNLVVEGSDLTLRIENKPGKDSAKYHSRHIFVNCDSIDLKLDFKMTPTPQQEAMVAVIPLTEEKQHFFYTIKMPNIESEGKIKVASDEHTITKENAGGFIDWGRGVWTYNTFWVFARAQGFLENGKRISLNFASGYGEKEANGATEDSFFIDDVMFKLNTVQPEFDENNLMNPWKFKTVATLQNNFKECEITFTPHYRDRKALNLFVLKSEMRTTYGQYTGWVTDHNNEKYTFENLNGFAEIYKGKW